MRWLGLSLLGPLLWALLFVAVYGAHGMACAGVTGPEGLGTGARLTMVGLWLAGLLAHGALLLALPHGTGLQRFLPRAGALIGLGASAVTLFPVVLVTSC